MFIYHVKPIILTNQNYISIYSQFKGTKTFLMNLSCSDYPASIYSSILSPQQVIFSNYCGDFEQVNNGRMQLRCLLEFADLLQDIL